MISVKFSVGNIVYDQVLSVDVSRNGDGDSDSYSVTVPRDEAVLKELQRLSNSTKGIQGVMVDAPASTATTTASQPVVAANPISQAGSTQIALPTPVSPSSVPSFPVPANEADRVKAIIAECKRQGVTDINQIAYVLATAEHECGRLGKVNGVHGYFIPITEFGGPFRYDPWRGRGLVQLTWEFNYRKYQQLTGRPLLKDPTLLIKDFGLSCFVLVHGSKNGTFTGRKLSDYIRPGSVDFVGARRIINGTDRASYIAGLANKWVGRLQRGQYSVANSPAITTSRPVTTAASPVITTVTANPVSTNVTTGTVAGPSKITANVVVQFPGTEAISGYYTGYDVDYSTITIKGSGFRKIRELVGSPLKIKPRDGVIVRDDGSSVIYTGKDNRKLYRIDNPLDVNQSESLANQLTVIKDKTVRGYPATVVIPFNPLIVPGDIVNCPFLYPDGDYRVAAVSSDGYTTSIECYLPIEVDIPDPPPPPQVQNPEQPQIGVGGTAQVNPVAPIPADGSILSRLLRAALANEGKPSGRGYSPAVTNNGRLACAWAINEYVLKPVYGRTFGSNPLAVVSVEAALLAAGWREVANPPPGAICTAVRMPSGGGHIGIIIGPGIMSLSNSSSRAAFSSRYPWVPYMASVYRPAKIRYIVPPGS